MGGQSETGVRERLVVLGSLTGGYRALLTVRLGGEALGCHVRYPDLYRPQPLGVQPFPVRPDPPPGAGAGHRTPLPRYM